MKKKTKTTRKNSVTKKAKKPKTRPSASGNLADSLYMNAGSDPAHSPGHRTMNLKATNSQGLRRKGPKSKMTREDQVQRTSATNRRIITGAALGKAGRLLP